MATQPKGKAPLKANSAATGGSCSAGSSSTGSVIAGSSALNKAAPSPSASSSADRLNARLGAAPRRRVNTPSAEDDDPVVELTERQQPEMRLLKAAACGDHDTCQSMVEEDTSLVDCKDKEGMTAMHHAALYGSVETIEVLLELQFDDEARDKKGRTALHLAASRGHSEIIELLVDIGCDVDMRASKLLKQWTPLMFASAAGHVDVIGILLHTNADVLDSKDTEGLKALDIATHHQQADAANALEVADEARRVRSKKERAAAMSRRVGTLQRANTKRELRLSSKFDLDSALQSSADARTRKLHNGFRRVSLMAGAIAGMMGRRVSFSGDADVPAPPAVRKSSSVGAKLTRQPSSWSMLRGSMTSASSSVKVNV